MSASVSVSVSVSISVNISIDTKLTTATTWPAARVRENKTTDAEGQLTEQ